MVFPPYFVRLIFTFSSIIETSDCHNNTTDSSTCFGDRENYEFKCKFKYPKFESLKVIFFTGTLTYMTFTFTLKVRVHLGPLLIVSRVVQHSHTPVLRLINRTKYESITIGRIGPL